ncbi:amidohydrolase family protein [Saccharopolyspora spinosa]|uniref:TIM-barrel fold metal-dependent hydrolase n=1 Tax=Saccharopolyspora spinosa TaxID=60894 RepID=A0A2N3Y1R7_SACSN|nr:amidohydrolase family protein [Saccharopolyspora spinosa]PKW16830.1 putative TIM-barrel fold metal-dependent hydrolase [Saccharopolyspora spinosa]
MTTDPSPTHAETAREPALPIIDPHHHLWSHPVVNYLPQEHYLIDELLTDTTAGHNVVGTVYVECSSNYRRTGPEALRPVGETEWVIAQRRPGRCELTGIVGYADPQLGDRIGEVLDAHHGSAGDTFRGIRCRATWDPSPDVPSATHKGLLQAPATQCAVAQLSRRQLIFEVWVYFHQLEDVIRLAQSNPSLLIVVDHLGSPLAGGVVYRGRRDSVLQRWRQSLRRLATLENVYLKIGGIGIPPVIEPFMTDRRWSSTWLAAYWGPEIRFCIESFGPHRCMFESNFPVDAYLCDYVTVWNIYKRITADLSTSERDALFYTTARTVYGLDLPTRGPDRPTRTQKGVPQ